MACEQALYFFSLFFDKQRDPRENARASSGAARGGGKEELATKGFSFLLHPVETKYYWLEIVISPR